MSLHEHAALGPALPHGRGLVHLLSPAGQRWEGQLRDPLQAPAGAAAFQLRLERPPHRGHRGDVEHVPNAVLRDLGGALDVGHRPDLSRYRAALETRGTAGGRLAARPNSFHSEKENPCFSNTIWNCERKDGWEGCGSERVWRQQGSLRGRKQGFSPVERCAVAALLRLGIVCWRSGGGHLMSTHQRRLQL